MHTAESSLPVTLRQARRARRLSQLDLALRLGVSQRHVSFVESGRARPSRELLLAWLRELEASLVLSNEVLLSAGFAPAFSKAKLDDPALAQVNHALERLLSTHDPMPALLLDADWNVLEMNLGARWLAATLVPWAAELASQGPVNMLDLLAHPAGFLARITNLGEVGGPLLAHLRHEASTNARLAERVEAIAALVAARVGGDPRQQGWLRPVAPVLTTRYETPHGELALFSVFTTFGTPQDITLASLRVEHMFAADAATEQVLRAEVRP